MAYTGNSRFGHSGLGDVINDAFRSGKLARRRGERPWNPWTGGDDKVRRLCFKAWAKGYKAGRR